MSYTKEDCIRETKEHVKQVDARINQIMDELIKRGALHDKSKMESPELEVFVEYTPKLKRSTYGSEEYAENLKGLGMALEHHYNNNSHHPEHYENGIYGMDLIDLVEMICDWKAASLRHADGNIMKSLEINKERFNIDEQLFQILVNTVNNMKW